MYDAFPIGMTELLHLQSAFLRLARLSQRSCLAMAY